MSASVTDWSRYLASVCEDYAHWWEKYTLTDVTGRQRQAAASKGGGFLLDLMAESVPEKTGPEGDAGGPQNHEQAEKIERFTVLEGLRKYAKGHVLLQGAPGSGKSTAMARLLLEEAEQARAKQLTIPVLIELRYYDQSLQQLIEDSLLRRDPLLDVSELEQWLSQGRLLLLLDGVNELPSEVARQDVRRFRLRYEKTTPMVFTTRKLGEGGDFGIGKKLTMQPLSEAQMRDFVQAYLPGQGKAMLAQLGKRLREFGTVPLLLWMLCSVYVSNQQQIPTNLGEFFRRFTQLYDDKLKRDVPDANKSKLLWPEMLQELAFRMIVGNEATEALVTISRTEAVDIIRRFLAKAGEKGSLIQAKLWLEDLLKYHLIQVGTATGSIQFRHQLIQEYYAAEKLLKQLPELSDEVLKWQYLNYLKWTEPLVLMAGLVVEEGNALRLVQLALEIDYALGARQAWAVLEEWQSLTIKLVEDIVTFQPLKTHLLSTTYSPTVHSLSGTPQDSDSYIRLNPENSSNTDDASAVPELLIALQHEDRYVRRRAVDALGKIGDASTVPVMLSVLQDNDLYLRRSAADALVEIGDVSTVPGLLIALQDEDWYVRRSAADALGKIGDASAVPGLLIALQDVYCWYVGRSAADALGKIGDASAVDGLLIALQHAYWYVGRSAVDALVEIGDASTVPRLLSVLQDENSYVRRSAADALGRMGNASAVDGLLIALQDKFWYVRSSAADALGKIGNASAVDGLLIAIQDETSYVRSSAADALVEIGTSSAVSGLIEALEKPSAETLDVFKTLERIQGRVGYYRPSPPMPIACEVFISYTWGGESETIADQLDQAFQSQRINIIRDKKDAGYKANIRDFMQQIGQGKCVLVVISDKYLKSENCMFELVEIAKNGDVCDRIFPIVLSDANIYKATARLKYIQHWEQQIEELEAAMKTGGLANLQGITDDLNLYTKIRNNIASLTDTLKNMNTLTPNMHRDSNFEAVIEAVKAKLAE